MGRRGWRLTSNESNESAQFFYRPEGFAPESHAHYHGGRELLWSRSIGATAPRKVVVVFPQRGACLCGDLAFSLNEDPLTLYACHCTDCQRLTGASFALSMIVRREALQLVRGRPHEFSVEMPDGRLKRSLFCSRCSTRLWGPSSVSGLAVLEPGTFDDTSWLRPVAHIWTRSAQPWIQIPEDALNFGEEPQADEWLALVRAWKNRSSE